MEDEAMLIGLDQGYQTRFIQWDEMALTVPGEDRKLSLRPTLQGLL